MTTDTGRPEDKIVYLLKPRGFCAGVVRAIDIVELALDLYGPPVYVRKEIVHNRHVVDKLASQGAIFVEENEEVPEGARVVFSAHGVSPEVREQGRSRRLEVIDATCPLVTKVHLEAVRFAREGRTILLIGHREHDEVIGTSGEAPAQTLVVTTVKEAEELQVPDPERVCYLTQTTLSLDETRDIVETLRRRFPSIQGPPAQDICYATENRQQAVKAVAPQCDLLLVVGSDNSSNSRRLVEVAGNYSVGAHLVDDARQLQPAWFAGVQRVAVTAGASAPEYLVQDLIRFLAEHHGFNKVEEVEYVEEDVRFALPPELVEASSRLTQIANVNV